MKVKLNIDPNQKETEIVINASELTPEIEQLYHALQKQTPNLEQIEAIKDDVSYYLNLSDILFFETDS